jgi:protein phosphatase inhibitor 2
MGREMSEKEIVLQNTIQNAGHRRSSSNPRGTTSRRQSGIGSQLNPADENSPRLKWDEANLYLTEQQRDSTMKITEPKTPFAKQYDPSEDEAEIAAIKADELMVDELDLAKAQRRSGKEDEIPGLDIGEPEMASEHVHTPEGEKRVIVDTDMVDDPGRHGEDTSDMTAEEREKHRKFEEMRKKHYEMKNVKDLLGHPEDEMDEDDDEQPRPMPTQ